MQIEGGRTAGPVPDPGLYRRYLALDPPSRPAVFLDRDGVVVEEVGYLHKPGDVRLIPGALESIASFNQAGLLVVMVTNQAGIARGYYGWEEFEEVQQEIESALDQQGGWLDGVWACAYHTDGNAPLAHPDHPFRKPNPGMILDALGVMPIDPTSSWLIGDKVCDLEAAIRGGLAGAIHVYTGHGPDHRSRVADVQACFPTAKLHVAGTLGEAAVLLLNTRRTI
jgi:D-glycero-D-manno-heptose 1,7-bisphosphate phosphatase